MPLFRKLLNRLCATADRLNRLPTPVERLQLAVVIPVSAEAVHHVTGPQLEILREFGHNPGLDAYPHITLKMGFEAADIAPFGDWLDTLASGVRSFEIAVSGIDSFDEGILFLEVEPNAELEALRQHVLSELSAKHGIKAWEIEGEGFRFHITLAQGFSLREFEKLKRTHASRRIEFKFTASHLALFCHTGRNWVSCRQAKLD